MHDVSPDNQAPTRRLSSVLAKVTLLLALALGAISGALQILTDLRQEKNAVQYSAEQFLSSVAPSAASAAYNYYFPAAEQVVEGLFTQRAISSVTIINEGSEMVSRSREVSPTLPTVGDLTRADLITLTLPLLAPESAGLDEQIGEISIVVDRSIVAPAFVNRMIWYFLFATAKNFLLGVLLILLVYGALTRHIIGLAALTRRWKPENGPLTPSQPPRLFQKTELETLGQQISLLAETARARITEVEASRAETERSNTELSQKSESLSHALERQNEELQQANRRLKELAERDALTGLLNRGSFDKLAEDNFTRLARDIKETSVLMIDVDHFKAYNDHYGHQAGDRCLIQVASILKAVSEDAGGVAARFGGEEFIVLLSGQTSECAMELAAAIHQELAIKGIPHKGSSMAGHVTVSIGVASFSAIPSNTIEKLISAADEALYEAKRSGRNRTVASTESVRKASQSSREQMQELLEAINAAEFVPYFQTQVDVRTGQVVGIEALARWTKADGTVGTPADFLEEARTNRLLPAIDELILNGSIDLIEAAASRGVSLPKLSLNAPHDTLHSPTYTEKLIRASRENTCQISLELLETTLLDRPDQKTIAAIDDLRSAGIQIEVDDFGTGHTSIVSLMSLQPKRLKIARELVLPLGDGNHLLPLVESVIQIAKSLDVEVIAEGVENDEVSQKLLALGCPIQQGFHFSRPVEAEELLKKLSRLAA